LILRKDNLPEWHYSDLPDYRLLSQEEANMYKSIVGLTVIYIFTTCPVLVGAQSHLRTSVKAVSAEKEYKAENAPIVYTQKMANATYKLNRMEPMLAKIDSSQTFTAEEIALFSSVLEEYGEMMFKLYNESVDDVKTASETKGTKGGHEKFLYFEDTSQKHVEMLKKLVDRHNIIEKKIRDGQIKPSKDTIRKMTPSEKKQYREQLTPKGKKEIEKAFPEMAVSLIPEINNKENNISFRMFCLTASKAIFAFFVSPAQASLALGCYTVCLTSGIITAGYTCIVCINAADDAVIDSYNKWKRCMASCTCKWSSPICCAKKTFCTHLFISILA
jgi:hypothetical protein